jgi:RimK-like ATP-grasp domain
MKVFLWGVLEDPPTKFVYDALLKLNADLFFLNHAEIENTVVHFTSLDTPRYYLSYDNKTWDMGIFTAAYLRPYDFTQYDQFKQAANSSMHQNAYLVHQFINNWSEYASIPIINKPAASSTNNSKLYQSTVISKVGFKIPATLVSNSIDEIEAFHTMHGRIIYKSMSGVRSIVEEYSTGQLQQYPHIGLMHFQKYIVGNNVRVHVVGDKIFASEITTSGIDYRYAQSTMEHFELPSNVAFKCLQLNHKLGLLFSGIDLINGANGEWYCLEVNTNPGFSYFDREADKPIATAIAKMLIGLN